MCTLEEEHVATKDLGERVLVQSSLGPVLGDSVAIHVSLMKLGLKFGVLSSNTDLGVETFNFGDWLSISINVDVEVRSQKFHFSENAREISHLGSNSLLKISKVSKKFNKIILISIKKTSGSLTL